MPKILILLFFMLPFRLNAQILPKDGSRLNYRLIGFSFPAVPRVEKYKIEIADGFYNSVDSFKRNIVQSEVGDSNKIIAEVPAFGKQYTWRVVYTGKKLTAKNSPFYHFNIPMNPRVDTGKMRLRILQPAEQFQDGYVSVDGGGVLYDMNGRPIWYVPDTNGLGGVIFDMQFTKAGTMTFIFDKQAYEINYNGDILWKAPNTGEISGEPNSEQYHHELTRLSNGHYMVFGTENLVCKAVYEKDTSYILVSDGKAEQNGYKKAIFSTIIEYDGKGNVVWYWKSSKHLIGSDFDYFKGVDSNLRFDPHDNAFFFDEKNKCIYISFRNLSRIMKIEYPSGRLLCNYGEIFKPGVPEVGNGLFCNLHSVRLTQDGYLYLFNNNSCKNTDSLPTIQVLQEPVSSTDSLKKIWEYTCTVEGHYPKRFRSAASVTEIADHTFLVNMGSGYSKLFIVNREKKVLWSALPERHTENSGTWSEIPEYRANFISRKDLERIIWNTEANTRAK